MRSFEKEQFDSVRGLSDWWARRFDWTTPNMLTLAGLILTFPMLWAFVTGRLALGAAFFAASATTDFLDGALARYQHDRMSEDERAAEQRKPVLLQRGKSEGGLNLDPLTDKVRYFFAIFPVGWDLLNHWLIWIGFGFATALSILRPIVKRLAGHEGKANRFGKFKAHFEIILVASLVPIAAGASPITVAGACAVLTCGLFVAVAFGKNLFIPGFVFWALMNAFWKLPAPVVLNAILAIATALGVMSAAGQVFTATMSYAKNRPQTQKNP